MSSFNEHWRKKKSEAFDLPENSTARRLVEIDFWGNVRPVYGNANLSVYSAQSCNARCPFCVEELRPSSRGIELVQQKRIEADDEIYFARLGEVLTTLQPLNPSVSMTGGEISKDPRLPRILRLLQAKNAHKRTLTTNGSGLLEEREGLRLVEWIAATGVSHLNISLAHYDLDRSERIMRYKEGPKREQLRQIIQISSAAGVRVRLSCVLLESEIDSVGGITSYLDFASDLGIDNVIFRQLMKTDARRHLENFVVKYSAQKRIALEPILNELNRTPAFALQKQIMGYYYYVEVWNYRGIDVVFEEADLAQLELTKRAEPDVIHELVFHPNATLSSCWQPWDGVLGPPTESPAELTFTPTDETLSV